MRRRKFIKILAGSAAPALLSPLPLPAQQADPVRHIGVLISQAADDPEGQARMAAFRQGLQQLGWTDGRNLRVDTRWGGGGVDRIRKDAAELVALAPNVILASGGQVVAPLLESTRTVPIVFTQTPDPVGAGFVASLARPGGNVTGFTIFEFGISGKWLELLKQVAPGVTRVAVVLDPTNPAGTGQWGAIQAVAPSFGVELSPVDVRTVDGIERTVTEFARGPDRGLIVTSNGFAILHRDPIIALAARHRLPAVYPFHFYAKSGGLVSYGPDSIEPHRLAAAYVDRILRGEKPADLPVQAPTKYVLAINLKTAKALGLDVPTSVLARADEVIE